MSLKLSQEQVIKNFISVHGDEFDYSKVVYVNAHKKVEIVCKKHGAFWQTSSNHFYCKKKCPFCSGRSLTKEQSLQIANPNLSKEWNFEKNGTITPSNVARSSSKVVWWKCSFGHEWQATINSRNNGNRCPFCNGKKVSMSNNLEKMYPILSMEWHPIKNKGLMPNQVVAHSHKKAWWICNKNHSWLAEIKARTKGNGCPFCSGLLASPEYNLEILYPEISKQWNHSKNNDLKPINFPPQSNAKVWWICELGHEWDVKISSRVCKKTGCPICSESKGEEKIRNFLLLNKIAFNRQKRFPKCKYINQLPFDFFVPMHNLLIEYQGIQHFQSKNFFGGEEAFKILKLKDIIKKSFCSQNGFEFLEIKYLDFENIDEILHQKLLF